MSIVDPDEKEEIKVSSTDTTASSQHSVSALPPMRVEPRPARPLAVVLDTHNSNCTASKCPVEDKNVAHTNTTMIIQNPTFLRCVQNLLRNPPTFMKRTTLLR